MTDESRRRFLAGAGASTLLLAAHRHLAWAALPRTTAGGAAAGPRILRLRLDTGAPLEAMKTFYHETLGLPLLAESETEITIGGGATPITFVKSVSAEAAPFYHFAFNIPENKIRAARAWQLERTELLPVFPRLRDPGYPDDVVHFSHWNAHSIFFLDPAGNVVEYIARHDLNNEAKESTFSAKDILHASEIAFVVDDVPLAAAGIRKAFDLDRYRTASDGFEAIGDEQGLLLVFKRGRNLSLGHGRPRLAGVFRTEADIRTKKGIAHGLEGYPYTIRAG